MLNMLKFNNIVNQIIFINMLFSKWNLPKLVSAFCVWFHRILKSSAGDVPKDRLVHTGTLPTLGLWVPGFCCGTTILSDAKEPVLRER